MIQESFYFGTIKNIIAAFGVLFSDISYEDDYGRKITVPLHYSAKEKFVLLIENEYSQPGIDIMDITLPRMGFELKGIHYDMQRMLNPLSKIRDVNDSDDMFMFNRVPYNFYFQLYIGTRKFEDSLKVIEQVVPFFTPELNISIKDKTDFGIVTNIPFILDNVDFEIEWADEINVRRSILWTLTITAKAWLYSNVRTQARIKEIIFNMGDTEFNAVYETLTSKIVPETAKRTDDYTIVDSNYTLGSRRVAEIMEVEMGVGGTMILDMWQDTNYVYWLFLNPVGAGETATAELITPMGPVTNFRFKFFEGERMSIGALGETPFALMPYQPIASTGESLTIDLMITQNFQARARTGESIFKTIFSYHEPLY